MDQDTNDDGRHQRRLRAAERLADQAFEARLGTMCKAGQSRRDRCLAVALRCDVGRLKGGGDSSPPEAMPLLRLSLLSSRADAWVSPQHRPARRTAWRYPVGTWCLCQTTARDPDRDLWNGRGDELQHVANAGWLRTCVPAFCSVANTRIDLRTHCSTMRAGLLGVITALVLSVSARDLLQLSPNP